MSSKFLKNKTKLIENHLISVQMRITQKWKIYFKNIFES